MSTRPTLSVIVPVYNTGPYLQACIDSLLCQHFKDFEVLLVDDGSSDGSEAICDSYAEKDPRVRVFHKDNGGSASARNHGIDHAFGEFIVFVDGDDIVTEDYLLHLMESDADLVVTGVHKFGAKTGTTAPARRDDFGIGALAAHWSVSTGVNYLYCYQVAKRFRTDIIKENGIRFDESLFFSEDMRFNMEYYLHADSFTELPYVDYGYRMMRITRDEKYRMSEAQLATHFESIDSCFRLLLDRIEPDALSIVRDDTNLRLMRKFCSFLMQDGITSKVFVRNVRAFRERNWSGYLMSLLKGKKEKRVMREAVRFPLLTYLTEVRLKSVVNHVMSRRVSLFVLLASFFVVTAFSCVKQEIFFIEPELEPDSSSPDTVAVYVKPADDPKPEPVDLEGKMTVTPYADLGYKHQSAAVYGDYAFFVRDGRSGIRLHDLAAKRRIYTYSMKGENIKIYHCNQSTFGTEKYEPGDYFPLLYISQRAVRENRCMTEVYRIIPLFNADSTALLAFRAELVQEIFFPPMSRENSMGNVNSVIDPVTGKMYTYSRNNAAQDDNYQRCKISRFSVPDVHQRTVVLEDADIESSFLIDTKASNMQGGCIVDGRLYIGQGYPPLEIFLNVVDLQEEKLVRRYNLVNRGVNWEPEGCFFYDGNVMLAYTAGISRIIEEE